MEDKTKRILLFLCGCIVVRILLVFIAKNIDINYLPYLVYGATLLAFGFMFIYLTGIRQTGPEVFGDKIWWTNLRPVHSLMYLLFSYNAINGNPNAWIYLLVDVIIGLISFLSFHYYNNDFTKLYN